MKISIDIDHHSVGMATISIGLQVGMGIAFAILR